MKLRLLGHDYTVATQRNLIATRGVSGELDKVHQTITVDAALPRSRCDEALLHEIFEAANYHLELQMSHPTLSGLCELIYAVLKDNGMWRSPWPHEDTEDGRPWPQL